MLEIDGSYGEGGGQIVRTAVAMSIVNDISIRIDNIRANRPNPGLSHQHLMALRAASEMCGGKLKGAGKGATEVTFVPGKVYGGSYRFDIGTAGSITLLLQALIPAALHADNSVKIQVRGGTDVKWSPPYDYFENVFLEHLRRMGLNISSKLIKRGHYPKGGGKVSLTIEPGTPAPIENSGDVECISGRAFVTSLPDHISRRMRKAVLKEFVDTDIKIELASYRSASPGTGITLWTGGNRLIGVGKLGEKGIPAEAVGKEVADYMRRVIDSGSQLDRWSADQLIPYIAMYEGNGEIKVEKLTGHLETNLWLVNRFCSDKIKIEKRENGLYMIY